MNRRVPMLPMQVMEQHGEEKLVGIKQQVQRGEYNVDPTAVADAILRRIGRLGPLPGPPVRPQNECSYPDSCSPEGPKLTPTSPRRTEPIQVRRGVPPSMLAIASGFRSTVAGMQTQIS
jgi:hypothetical protein